MRTMARVAVVALLVGVPVMAQTAPSTPSTRPGMTSADVRGKKGGADTAGADAIKAAVAVLTKDYEESKGPNRALSRGRSNYFTDVVKAGGVAPPADAVLEALGRRQHPDAVADGYIKWQLTSALPATGPDAKTAGVYAGLLSKAPLPPPRPGVEQGQRQQIEQQGSRARRGEEEQFNDQLSQLVQKHSESCRGVLGYRDFLLGKLPPGFDRLRLLLVEASTRVQLGIDAGPIVEQVASEARTWAAGSATPGELQQLITLLQRAKTLEGPEFPTKLSVEGGSLKWDRDRRRIESWNKPVEKLLTDLQTRRKAGGY